MRAPSGVALDRDGQGNNRAPTDRDWRVRGVGIGYLRHSKLTRQLTRVGCASICF